MRARPRAKSGRNFVIGRIFYFIFSPLFGLSGPYPKTCPDSDPIKKKTDPMTRFIKFFPRPAGQPDYLLLIAIGIADPACSVRGDKGAPFFLRPSYGKNAFFQTV